MANPVYAIGFNGRAATWHKQVILIPDRNLELGFENEVDFLDYIRQNNLNEPEWLEPLAILQKYNETGCLDWIPDCIK